ncbi:MAG: SLC13 family permease [Beijerinckiaceae bacterium]
MSSISMRNVVAAISTSDAARDAQAFVVQHRRSLVAAFLAAALAAYLWIVPTGLSPDARLGLILFGLCVIGWTLTPFSDTLVALAACIALVAFGAAKPEDMYKALGSELVWLLIASFVIAAALKASGLSDRLVRLSLSRVSSIRGLFVTLTLVIAATALVIPSTSGRAALLLPVFLSLAKAIPDRGIVRALALLFPTVILLSAGGSLIGAGAHLVAVDFIARLGGPRLSYGGWLLVAMPFALATSLLAMALIMRLFLDREQRRAVFRPQSGARQRWTQHQLWLGCVTITTVAAWIATPWHGLGLGVAAIAGALAATLPRLSPIDLKTGVKAVEWEMLLFMAATLMLGEALLASNADEWMARRMLLALGGRLGESAMIVLGIVVLIALFAHLAITSRTARATVLIPALAIPLLALGFNPAALILVTVMGTGFCQTLPASAKPVALFATAEVETYTPADLLKLSLWLAPVMFAGLMLMALVVWPSQGLPLMR